MTRSILNVSEVCKTFHKSAEDIPTNKIGWQAMWSTLLKNKQQNSKVLSFNALQEISFSVSSGKSLGIVGLNGSGKTTLLQIIAGTLQPTKGHVYFEGRITALLELGSGFNPDFTGIENIYLSASLHGLETHQIDSRLEKIIEFADIGEFISQPLRTYSSGMALRLAFAVCANINANILIIDEALAVGDAAFQAKCFSYLENFKKKGGSLILVSHDLNSIALLCENSILLNKGRLISQGKSINVINEYSKFLAKFLSKQSEEVQIDSNRLDQNKNLDSSKKENIQAISYGGEKGLISNVKINGGNTAIIQSGDPFTISFKITAHTEIKEPIFALRIRDIRGIEIYGTNTKLLNFETPELKPGNELFVRFTQQANLGAGNYFISIGYTFYDNENLNVIHRLRECNEFEVINGNKSFGVSNCFSSTTIEQINF